jgi:hypothetical protein
MLSKANKLHKRKVTETLIKYSELPGEHKDQIIKKRKTEIEPPKPTAFRKTILATSTGIVLLI